LSLTMGTGVIKLRILLSQIPVEWSTLCKLKFQSLVLEREGSWYPIIDVNLIGLSSKWQ
jgi:hypothetical protein